MTEALHQGTRVPSSPTRKRSDNVTTTMNNPLLLHQKKGAASPTPTSPRTTASSSSSTTTTTTTSSSSSLSSSTGTNSSPDPEATSRKFSKGLFGAARKSKRAVSCAVVMGSAGPSPGAALLSSSPGAEDMSKWEEFQKRYRLLGIDDGGLDAHHPGGGGGGGETKEAPAGAKESKKEKKDKAAGSRTPRLSKGRNNADTLTPHDTGDGGNAGKKDKGKKESKKAKKDKRDSKKDKGKKDKSKSTIVRRDGGEAGGGDCSSSGSECEDGADALPATGNRQASPGGEKRGLGHRMRMSMRLGSREELGSSQQSTAAPNAGPSPAEYGSLRLPLSARRGVNPLLLGSFPNRGMDRALSDEVESGPLTAGRKRLASSPARVQVGRWERRTFHSGEMGGNEAVLSQLLKMAENIKKGQTGEGAEDFCAGSGEPGEGGEEEDFAGQEEEVRRVVREEQLRRAEEAIERERTKLRKLEARIRRAEKKLQRRKRASSAPTTPSSLLSRSGRLRPPS